LIDDGLRLWSAVLATSEQLPQPLQELLAQRLPAILRRGQDTAACLKIAEGHALLGGALALPSAAAAAAVATRVRCKPVLSQSAPMSSSNLVISSSHLCPHVSSFPCPAGLPAVAPLLGQLAASITESMAKVVNGAAQQQQQIAAALAAPHGQQQQRPPSKGLAAEQATESTAAATLLALLVQLSHQATDAAAAAAGGGQQQQQQQAPPELPAELEPAAKAAAAVAATDFGGGTVRLPHLGMSLVEACLEVGSVGGVGWPPARCARQQ
jgi:hypothetical protein